MCLFLFVLCVCGGEGGVCEAKQENHERRNYCAAHAKIPQMPTPTEEGRPPW